MRPISGFLVLASLLTLPGCYGFAGGGLPPSIKTVAVLPFDNQTPEPTLTQEISRAVREAVEQRLGLRQSAEPQADAVVRGSITRYEPDLPVAYQGGEDREVTVTQRQVQITVTVEILDQKQSKPLWQRTGLVVKGDYQTGREAEGRRKALDDLVVNIVEGAQSQW
ncbi:MAG TPA: LptE family protein [Gemmatimonadales bacterium]|nr:LptE family protein [Gemmatimonadales bacterium]